MINKWTALIEEKLFRWFVFIIKMLPNFVLAALVIVLFIIIARFTQKLSAKIIRRISKSESISSLTSGVLYTFVILIGIMISLNILKLEQAVTSLLAGVGIIGLALGFAFQDLTSNFISGTFIAFKRPFDIGHTVETNGFIGTIEEIQLRATRMRTFAGLHVIIPNKDIFQKPIINYSLSGERRVELEFLIPNTVDLAFGQRILNEAMLQLDREHKFNNVEIYFSAIEDPKIKIYISFWTPNNQPNEYRKARHEAIMAVYEAFSNHKIYTAQINGNPA